MQTTRNQLDSKIEILFTKQSFLCFNNNFMLKTANKSTS